MALAERAAALGNLNAISDAASAASLAHAALASAGYNVRINISNLADRSAGEPLLEQLSTLEKSTKPCKRAAGFRWDETNAPGFIAPPHRRGRLHPGRDEYSIQPDGIQPTDRHRSAYRYAGSAHPHIYTHRHGHACSLRPGFRRLLHRGRELPAPASHRPAWHGYG